MSGSGVRWIAPALLVLAALGAAHGAARAQPQAYRCGPHTYSQVACTGGRPVGVKPHRETDRSRTPPQDRAVAAKRAVLAPEARQECRMLDVKLREEQRLLTAKGEAATLDDEMPLVHAKKRFRTLGC
jgi:hypothetical protein